MNWRKFIYRLYLKSPGWRLTKWLRKWSKCQNCGDTGRLELHHESYAFHNAHKYLRWIIPNMWDEMKTLCRACHKKRHNIK